MNDSLLMYFIAATTFAVVIQAGILVGLYLAVRKSSVRMEALATEFKDKVLPTVETAQGMLTELKPRIEAVTADVSESTALVRTQLTRLDATLTDVLDRTRL